MSETEKLKSILHSSEKIVFFGGAGVSTESGIPDYRSVDGLYNQRYKYPPEIMLSHSFFVENTEEFYDFYKNKMICLDAQPNFAHIFLAQLENQGKLTAVITQNIDGLHQKAGSKCVFELHGSVHRNKCQKCGSKYSAEFIKNSVGVPRCEKCGGVIKPDVVLYEEQLDGDVINGAVHAIESADTFIIGGTSLAVYPAAGLIDYFRGKNLVLINKTATNKDSLADLVIREPIGKCFEKMNNE
ncbi:MAG: NAD-dependent protein deacylase [Clostridia bacterium]|nr:NAD-dependent protein deacylase [Clostridia bacterium]